MATKGKRSFHQYPEQALQDAISEIRGGGISVFAASVKYGVPRTTIYDRINGRVPEGPRRMGPPTVLTKAEEDCLEKWCHDLAKCGFPLKTDDLLNTVQTIIKKEKRVTPFVNDRPGRKWVSSFLKRHPSISIREAEGISKGRAIITEECIRKWFAELKSFLSERNDLAILEDPSRIFNGDETSFCLCPKTGGVLAPKGFRNVYSIQRGNEKETVTVLLVFSANGKTVEPMIVFPYVRIPKDIVSSLPDKWFLGKSETGWMICETFYEYIANCFHNWLSEHNVQRPVLLFVDGHKSHMTMELSEFCENNEIILYALPPNTTHIMQPADVSVFKPLKTEWKKTVRKWQSKPENHNQTLSKSTFCPLLHMVLSELNIEETIKNGFRKCGLYPFNADNVDYTKCVKNILEELTTERNESEEVLTETDFDKCEAIINMISPKLLELGIDLSIVIEEIRAMKNSENVQDIEITCNTSVQSGIYTLNEEGVLERENSQPRSPTPANKSHTLVPDHCSTPTSQRKEKPSSLFEDIVDCPSPSSSICSSIIKNVLERENSQPRSPTPANKSHTLVPDHCSTPTSQSKEKPSSLFENIVDCPSPSSSICSSIIKNVLLNPISCSPTGSTTLVKNIEVSMSPSFQKHLYFPKPLPSPQQKTKIKAPSAISAFAWREHIQAKENEKIIKAEAIKKRKLERQNRKTEKENKSRKLKKRKHKQVCNTCNEELDTDAEDDDLKNVGCDTCPQWYHLKCTGLRNVQYNDLCQLDFVCKSCQDQNA